MADWYSDHFGADGSNDNSQEVPKNKVDGTLIRGRKYVKRAVMVGMPLITEIVRMMSFRSGDRLYKLELFASGGTAGAMDIGLYLAGNAHDGALVDVDLFASATTGASTIDGTDVFDESTNLIATDRGKFLWQLADKGAATYTADPFVTFDVCFTVTTSFTTADATLMLIAEFTAGS
jgi:hypothetical protein